MSWSAEEIEKLRELAKTLPLTEAARRLHRDKSLVHRIARLHGILFDVKGGGGPRKIPGRVYRAWTKKDDDALLEVAGVLSYRQAGFKLKRTPGEIYRRVRKLGIRWTVDEGRNIDVAAMLGVCPETVSYHKKKLGQTWRRNMNWGKPWCKRLMRSPSLEEVKAVARSILETRGYNGADLDWKRLKEIAYGGER